MRLFRYKNSYKFLNQYGALNGYAILCTKTMQVLNTHKKIRPVFWRIL